MKPIVKTLILVLIASFFSCTDEARPESEDNANLICGVKDPIKDLKWLNDEFKEFKGGPEGDGIVVYKYNGQTIIEVQNSLFNSTNMHQHFCNGDKLNLEATEAIRDYKEKRIFVKILYGVNLWN